MPRTVRLSDKATAAIRRWQTQPGSGAAAKQRVKTIVAAIRRLRRTPCLYGGGELPGTRELAAAGHRIVYQVDPDTGDNRTAGNVLLLRVYGPG